MSIRRISSPWIIMNESKGIYNIELRTDDEIKESMKFIYLGSIYQDVKLTFIDGVLYFKGFRRNQITSSSYEIEKWPLDLKDRLEIDPSKCKIKKSLLGKEYLWIESGTHLYKERKLEQFITSNFNITNVKEFICSSTTKTKK